MTDKKRQPEVDMALKYLGQFLTKKLDDILDTAEKVVDDFTDRATDTPKETPSIPPEVLRRIEKAVTKHTIDRFESTTRVCRCGRQFNELAYITHLRDEIAASLSAPDPATTWWKSVTDTL